MRGQYRSRSAKKRSVKTPKKTQIHFKKKKKGLHRCAHCGALLHGVARERGTSFRPSRKYGGYLCHTCVKKLLVESVRA
ncbi:MAG: 50S ribosomal protein L34e [Theionarchaea archaeon]|nr:MAG: hypothetical protein AYK19_13940 [Theionarchaea archaeon DG-70-1]MBU7026873.1 50S ribosomal protein L34e [Theionarchaea archaeon]